MCVVHRPDEVQIVVANSELAIERGDFDQALKILGDVSAESPAYVRVQVRCGQRYNIDESVVLVFDFAACFACFAYFCLFLLVFLVLTLFALLYFFFSVVFSFLLLFLVLFFKVSFRFCFCF